MTRLRVVAVSLRLTVYWVLGCVLLWLSYGLSIQVNNGSRTKQSATISVMAMSLIISVLTLIAWFLYMRLSKPRGSGWRKGLMVFLCTGAALATYSTVVIVRRNLWTPAQGMSVYAQLLPVVGAVNAEFFSEFNWIIFLIEVIPAMSLASAILFSMRPRAQDDGIES